MGTVFALLFLASLVALPIGLINPKWITRKDGVSRKKYGLSTLLISAVLLIATGAAQPDAQSQSAVQGVTTQSSIPAIVNQSAPSPDVVASPTSVPELVSPSPSPSVLPSPKPNPSPTSDLSNDNCYTNSAGNTVHSPAYSDSVPAGATAVCGDGTYSFSQSRRGTCSHHGGVAQWL